MVFVILSRKAREIILCVLLLTLPVIFLYSNVKDPSDINAFDRVILKISAPIQQASVAVFQRILAVWKDYIYLVNLREENKKLRRENKVLRANNRILSAWASRGRKLERLLRFKRESPAEMVAAKVIGRSVSPYFRVVRLRLDRGSDLVKPGMPVVVPEGVVGRVHRTFGSYSDVLLSVDPSSRIDVVDRRTGARGVLKGSGGQKEYTARIDYLLRQDEVNVGDAIITSGMGGRFPKDLPVGKVVKVLKKTYGLYQKVIVKPAVDFSKLTRVMVVVSPPPPPDPNAPKPGHRRKRPRRTGLKPYG
jgi:rod shape-determining protein MreC